MEGVPLTYISMELSDEASSTTLELWSSWMRLVEHTSCWHEGGGAGAVYILLAQGGRSGAVYIL
jgi:hypothetical protein